MAAGSRALLVGVGVATPPPAPLGSGLDAVGLMVEAARAAAEDAEAPSLLRAVDQIAVPKGSWSCADPGRLIAGQIDAARARSILVEAGIPQQTLVSSALRAITAGAADVVLVVGGEARRRAALAARAGVDAPEQQADTEPDEHHRPSGEIVSGPEIRAGLTDAVQQYAMIESALRAAEGLTIDDHLDDIAWMWSDFNAVAVTNPRAAFPAPMDAAALRVAGPGNRPLAFPYAKWHSTQWTVDQAAALLLCSADTARSHGIAPERCLVPLVALESSFALALPRRRQLHRWPAMAVLGQRAAQHLGLPLSEIEHVDLYSCFPAAVRVQQRELGLPLDAAPTVTGGMAFAGGPFNSYTFHATVAVAERLRADPGALGMVTTVSGFLTKPGLAVWRAGATTVDHEALVDDMADEARAATEAAPLDGGERGQGRIAALTVTYDAGGAPARTTAIADTAEGGRVVVTSDDAGLAMAATSTEVVGASIDVDGRSFIVTR